MAEIAWEKPKHLGKPRQGLGGERLKFLAGGGLILAAILYLLVTGTLQGARFFITVEEALDDAYSGQTVRVSGAVDGESIEYDSENAIIRFTIVHIPTEFDDLAAALHAALKDPAAARMNVLVEDEAIPDLLQHEAQAILTGALQGDGIFHASELLLKCPSRFEETTPDGLNSIPEHQ